MTRPSPAVRRGGAALGIAVVVAVFAVFPIVFSNPTTTTIAFFTLVYMVVAHRPGTCSPD